jgi:hypothetical protein
MILALLAQAADLGTFMMAPHLESNPAMAALPPTVVVTVKMAGALLALAICQRLRSRAAFAFVAFVGALGAIANLAALGVIA